MLSYFLIKWCISAAIHPGIKATKFSSPEKSFLRWNSPNCLTIQTEDYFAWKEVDLKSFVVTYTKKKSAHWATTPADTHGTPGLVHHLAPHSP